MLRRFIQDRERIVEYQQQQQKVQNTPPKKSRNPGVKGTGCSSGILKEVRLKARLKGKSCSRRFLSLHVSTFEITGVCTHGSVFIVSKKLHLVTFFSSATGKSAYLLFFFLSTRRQLYRRVSHLTVDWQVTPAVGIFRQIGFGTITPCRLASRYCSKTEEIGYRGGLYFLSWMLNIIIIIRDVVVFSHSILSYCLFPFCSPIDRIKPRHIKRNA